MYEMLKDYISALTLLSSYTFMQDILPDTPDEVIDIHEYAGASPLPQVSEVCRNFQILVRNTEASKAKSDSINIYKACRNSTGTINLSDGVHGIIVPTTPEKIKTDNQSRATYGFSLCIISTL